MKSAHHLVACVLLGQVVAVQAQEITRPSVQQKEEVPSRLEIAEIGPDHGADVDGDGLFESLQVPVWLKVPASGEYLISFALKPEKPAGPSKLIKAQDSRVQRLEIGRRVVQAAFDGPMLSQSHHDGRYELVVTIRAFQDEWKPDAGVQRSMLTGTYAWRQFAPKQTYCTLDGVVITDLSRCPGPAMETSHGR